MYEQRVRLLIKVLRVSAKTQNKFIPRKIWTLLQIRCLFFSVYKKLLTFNYGEVLTAAFVWIILKTPTPDGWWSQVKHQCYRGKLISTSSLSTVKSQQVFKEITISISNFCLKKRTHIIIMFFFLSALRVCLFFLDSL